MKTLLLLLSLSLASASVASAQTTITITTAQEDAEFMARTGILRHCRRNGWSVEGIGMSSVSADAAIKRSCYWGLRPVREIGVARSPLTGRWYAVVRYK